MTATYRYADGTTQVVAVTIAGLDAVPLANATERTAPRRVIRVERALLVRLLNLTRGVLDGACTRDEEDALDATLDELAEVIA